jgi:hypothetical protein
MIKNFILFTLAALLLALVVLSGMKTLQQDARWLLVFGLACAFLAPVGLEILKHLFTMRERDRERLKIEKLYKVGDINELINEAETMEEKVRLLNEERRNLGEIIRIEANRQALLQRREMLASEASRILNDYQTLETEFNNINLDIASEEIMDELENLKERLSARKKNLVIFFWGHRQYIVDSEEYVGYLPYGMVTFLKLGIRGMGELNNYFHNKRKAHLLISTKEPVRVYSEPSKSTDSLNTGEMIVLKEPEAKSYK